MEDLHLSRTRLSALLVAFVAACGPTSGPVDVGGDGEVEEPDGVDACAIPASDLTTILAPDEIPALVDPTFVGPYESGAAPWTDESRVIGLVVDGEPLAVPLGIMRHHEIVNLSRGHRRLAVTYCPLTGSALAFDRSAVDGSELGVSGILMRNNLVLYDRNSETPSFFAQMTRNAVCGPLARHRRPLPPVASWEMRWDAWRALYPETRVVSFDTGFARAYDVNLNSEYEELDNPDRLIAVPLDPRRPPKERVLGVPLGVDGGPAFPFEAMRAHRRLVMTLHHDGRPAVVFWDRSAEGATTFYREMDGRELDFEVTSGGFRDVQTGSSWRLDGLAAAGPSAGNRLEPVEEAYVAFWFAWADFHPETVVRTP